MLQFSYKTEDVIDDAMLGYFAYNKPHIAKGDFFNDGFDDLIFFPSYFTEAVYIPAIVYNNVNGKFETSRLDNNFEYIRATTTADFNGDNIDDAILADTGWELDGRNPESFFGANLRILTGSADGIRSEPTSSYGAPPTRANGRFHHAIDSADMDEDGDVDLLVSSGQNVDLYSNDGNGVFTYVSPEVIAPDFLGPADGGEVDYNQLGSGFVDFGNEIGLAAGNYISYRNGGYENDDGRLQIYRRNADDKYVVVEYLNRPTIGDIPEAWGITKIRDLDVNNDGLNDLIVGSETEPSQTGLEESVNLGRYVISVYLQSSDGSFEENPELSINAFGGVQGAVSFNIVDVNLDGYQDLVSETVGMPATELVNSVYLNTRNGAFEKISESSIDLAHDSYDQDWFAVTPVWMDIDNDRDTDLIAKRPIYRNPSENGQVGEYLDVFLNDGETFQSDRLELDSRNIAFDLDGSAGQASKTLVAVLGVAGLSNKEYVGIGLQLFDAGQSLATVCELALNAVGATTNEDVVTTLYSNLYGESPSDDQLQEYVELLDQGVFTKGSLAAAAAELTDDLGVIDLVGLAETGIEYV